MGFTIRFRGGDLHEVVVALSAFGSAAPHAKNVARSQNGGGSGCFRHRE